jgi:hypothetical protein
MKIIGLNIKRHIYICVHINLHMCIFIYMYVIIIINDPHKKYIKV